MNELVIKLAKEAGVLRTEYAAPQYGIHSEPALVDLMKFAELIIQECGYLLDSDYRIIVNTLSPQATCHEILKNHFGIHD
jgi:hypothetical protein